MGLFGGGANAVVGKGTRSAGTIVGISVRRADEDDLEPERSYAVRLGDGRTLGIRQRLDPADVVRLGMEVSVLVRGGDAVIDARHPFAALDTHKWKALKNPPANGIDDETLGLGRARRKHAPATVRLLALERRSTMFGLGSTLRCSVAVTIDGEAPYAIDLNWGTVPHYATHLVAVGRELPALVDRNELDKVWIDWPTAAMRDPGVGVAPEPVTRHDPELAAESVGTPATIDSLTDWVTTRAGGAETEDEAESIDGVTFEQWIAIEAELARTGLRSKPKQWDEVAQRHGLTPGAYAAASPKWARAMISRPDLATRYAEAMR
jgi:hypothetical protein